MFKTLSLAGAAIAIGAAAVIPVAPAMAQRGYYNDRYDNRGYDYRGHDDRGYRRGYYDRAYDGGNYYRERYRNASRRNNPCNDGTGGTVVGAIAGGLLGHVVAGRGDRTVGAVLGAGAGALAGRAIDRSDRPGYCRR